MSPMVAPASAARAEIVAGSMIVFNLGQVFISFGDLRSQVRL
jgi:hypothetical protein